MTALALNTERCSFWAYLSDAHIGCAHRMRTPRPN